MLLQPQEMMKREVINLLWPKFSAMAHFLADLFLIGLSPNLTLSGYNIILPQELDIVTYYDYPSTNGFEDELDGYNYFACVNEDAAKW